MNLSKTAIFDLSKEQERKEKKLPASKVRKQLMSATALPTVRAGIAFALAVKNEQRNLKSF